MNRIPFNYIWRNLLTRKLTTALTAGGMALVVFVFTAVLMLDAGLKATMVASGRPDNVVVIRSGSETEVQSSIDNPQMGALESLPHIALDGAGRPLLVRESLVLYSLVKKDTGVPTNVTIRGTGEMGLALRPQVRLKVGRAFRPGSSEIIVGASLAKGFAGVEIGQTLSFARRDWLVVGIFDAGKTAFNSEVWGDAEQLRQAFRRPVYSSLVFQLDAVGNFGAVKKLVVDDRRLTVEMRPETQYYADQSKFLAGFISILGLTLSIIFSIGAIIGAMITMYAAVASRTAEIGTLRAIGFRRTNILIAFLAESLLLSLLGGVVGLAAASGMQAVSISTMNWQTFAELAFAFKLTPDIALASLIFSLTMGFLGGVLPAWRAARLNIVAAVRAS
ncbi:ABC transporter permease [Uliginosibacterium sp. 31-16]|uniref:ABC transporter permease n=1 Tax=Uliginosibacterium sp. 31-16 TaxID=3068315 RepID=UPI00273F8EB8|nr:ABC transporter permease [Uliginosibacterium sp. 31-16]MDP5240226.1 ABC transporter permease [Uliginosibacterium sp. 31-16]